MSETSKIFVEFSSVEERDRAAPLLRSFIERVFERGLRQARETPNEPLPEVFMQLFGRSGIPTEVLNGSGEKFRQAAPGGAIHARERIILSAIKKLSHTTFNDTSEINDSLISDVGCVLSVSNPALSGLIEQIAPAKRGK